MTGEEFTALVLSALTRATAEEREEVRRELAEHMEDRAEALVAAGMEPEAAGIRAAAAMGDPLEIGQALNRQYSSFWLWLGRAAAVLTAVLCAQILFGLGLLGHAIGSLEARIYPDMLTMMDTTDIVERMDLRMEIGNDVLRVFRVSVGEREGRRVAEVSMCAYDQRPFGMVMDNWWNKVRFTEQERLSGSNGYGSATAEYWQTYVPLRAGTGSLTLTYDYLGTVRTLEIPLPGQEGAA